MTSDVRQYPEGDPSEAVWLLLNVLRVPEVAPLLALLDLDALPGSRVCQAASAALERIRVVDGEAVGGEAALEEFARDLELHAHAASRLSAYARTQLDTQGRHGLGVSALVSVLFVLWHVAWRQGAPSPEIGSRLSELRVVLRAEIPRDRWAAQFEAFEDELNGVDAEQLEAGLLPVTRLITRRGTERAWRATVELLNPSELSQFQAWVGAHRDSIGVSLWRHGDVLPSLEDEVFMLPSGWEL